MALKSKLPTKAISSCCGKYRLKPDDPSCFPKVGTTQTVVFSALGSNVLLSGVPFTITLFNALGRQKRNIMNWKQKNEYTSYSSIQHHKLAG